MLQIHTWCVTTFLTSGKAIQPIALFRKCRHIGIQKSETNFPLFWSRSIYHNLPQFRGNRKLGNIFSPRSRQIRVKHELLPLIGGHTPVLYIDLHSENGIFLKNRRIKMTKQKNSIQVLLKREFFLENNYVFVWLLICFLWFVQRISVCFHPRLSQVNSCFPCFILFIF